MDADEGAGMTTAIVARADEHALEPVEQARELIAWAVANREADALHELRRRASAAELYNRRAGAREVANDAGEIKVRAERGLGQIDRQMAPHGGDRRQASGAGNLLADIRAETRAAWRRLGKIAEPTFDEYVALARDDEEAGVSTAQLVRIARVGGAVSSTTFECHTPARYVDAARQALGAIDLDPASSDEANRTVRARRIYTAADDGLQHEWQGRVWLNPPYGRSLTAAFVTKAIAEHDAGNVTALIVLLNAYGFDAAWFQPLWQGVLCFTDHRIPFYGGGPTFGSLFVYLGPRRARFAQTFRRFGAVLEQIA